MLNALIVVCVHWEAVLTATLGDPLSNDRFWRGTFHISGRYGAIDYPLQLVQLVLSVLEMCCRAASLGIAVTPVVLGCIFHVTGNTCTSPTVPRRL